MSPLTSTSLIAVCSKVGGPVILMFFCTFQQQDLRKPFLNNYPIFLHDTVLCCNLLIEL